jgi:hypothetical protein
LKVDAHWSIYPGNGTNQAPFCSWAAHRGAMSTSADVNAYLCDTFACQRRRRYMRSCKYPRWRDLGGWRSEKVALRRAINRLGLHSTPPARNGSSAAIRGARTVHIVAGPLLERGVRCNTNCQQRAQCLRRPSRPHCEITQPRARYRARP